jgi:hypothetical protein
LCRYCSELLRELGQYVVAVVKAMGPSFLELVAEDIGGALAR